MTDDPMHDAAGGAVHLATVRIGDAIHAGTIPPKIGYEAIGSVAAWGFAAEQDLAVAIGGRVDHKPSELYPLAGEPEHLRAYTEVLRAAGVPIPWACPDCAVMPGERHEDGCDVARCVGCGHQQLQCDTHYGDVPLQTWTGRWPGSVECEEGIAKDLNHLAMCGLGPEPILLWDRDLERWRKP